MACLTEPSKLVANRVIWKAVAATWYQRLGALVWYILCIAVSIGLLHLLVERSLSTTVHTQQEERAARAAQERSGEAELAELRLALKEAETALESARSAQVPGIAPAAEIRARLTSRDAPSRAERLILERDLGVATTNAQAQAKIDRWTPVARDLREKIEKSRGDRSRTMENQSEIKVARIAPVARIDEIKLKWVALLFALVLEMVVSLGIWADTLYNRRHAPVAPAPMPAPIDVETPKSITAEDQHFEAWLLAQWRSNRSKDGWLEGTQRSWATAANTSQGFVYSQLERMVNEGKIDKKAAPRKTWIRFRQQSNLKLIK